jgi:quinol monooxygenase YgiN
MSPKTQKTRKTQKDRKLEVNKEATKILRTVSDEEAFYFYEAVGKPTGQNAKSLSGFLEKISSVKSESLLFHLQREDFQKWIRKTLGDSKLAREIGKLSSSNREDVRANIHSIIEKRIRKLSETSQPLLVSEDLAVAFLGSKSLNS